MFIFALSGFINGLFALIFGIFVYLKNKKEKINKLFLYVSISVAVWGLSYGIWQVSKDKEMALFWTRMLSLGANFIPIFFMHWVFALLNIQEKKKKILILSYALTLFFTLFSFSPLYVKDVEPILDFDWWPRPGILYVFYIILGYIGISGYTFYILFKGYKRAAGIERPQIKYVIIGTFIGLSGGFTNFLLWYKIPFPPYGTFLVPLYPFVLGYAVSRYQLMNIRLILTQFFVALVGFILLTNVFLSESFNNAILSIGLFLAFCGLGYLLIRSVQYEIKRREQFEKLSNDLQKANIKLEELDKAKSEFISIASHQLRTPLTAIKSYISMILEGFYGKTNKKVKEKIERIYISNERIMKLINDLLDISKIEAGKMEMNFKEESIEEVVAGVIDDFDLEAKQRGVYLKFEKPKTKLPLLLIDKDKIRHIVSNIIDNAIKYTPKGGITVKLQHIIEYAFGGLPALEKIQIIIQDTGIGMTSEELNRLFERFSRGKRGRAESAGGSGLGLYIAKRFTEMHKGKVWVESEGKSKGSTFYIELPLK